MSIPVLKTAENPSVFHRHDVTGIRKYDPVAELRTYSCSLAGIERNREIMQQQPFPFLTDGETPSAFPIQRELTVTRK